MSEPEAGPQSLASCPGAVSSTRSFSSQKSATPIADKPLDLSKPPQTGSNSSLKTSSTNSATPPQEAGEERARGQSKGSGVSWDPGLAYTRTLSVKLSRETKDAYDLNIWVIS